MNMPKSVFDACEVVRTDAANTMTHCTTSDLTPRLMCQVDARKLGLVLAWVDQLATRPTSPLEAPMTSDELRGAVALKIGSYVVHDDNGGPDAEVLHDVIGGDHDEATRRVYELTDAILSLLNSSQVKEAGGAEGKLKCRRCVECEGEEHHWMYVGDEDDDGEPVMSCKHCDATRPIGCDDE